MIYLTSVFHIGKALLKLPFTFAADWIDGLEDLRTDFANLTDDDYEDAAQ